MAFRPLSKLAPRRSVFQLVDQGVDPADLAKTEREAITIARLCDEYMQAARAGMVATRSGKPKRASTLHQDESRISAHIKPLLGDKLVKDLTQARPALFRRCRSGEDRQSPSHGQEAWEVHCKGRLGRGKTIGGTSRRYDHACGAARLSAGGTEPGS